MQLAKIYDIFAKEYSRSSNLRFSMTDQNPEVRWGTTTTNRNRSRTVLDLFISKLVTRLTSDIRFRMVFEKELLSTYLWYGNKFAYTYVAISLARGLKSIQYSKYKQSFSKHKLDLHKFWNVKKYCTLKFGTIDFCPNWNVWKRIV